MKNLITFFITAILLSVNLNAQETRITSILNSPGKIKNHPDQDVLPYNAPCSDCKEDLSKRTGVRREFYKMETGGGKTIYMQQSLGEMNFLDHDGYWRAIDPILKKESETVYAARQQTSAVEINFGSRYTSLNYAGKEFRFNKNISLSHISEAGVETTLGEGDWSRMQKSVSYSQTIFTLQDFYPGIDLQFVTSTGSVESNFIIRNKQQFTGGWLVMKQELDIPAGLKADNSAADPADNGMKKGMLLIKDSNNENYFYFRSAHAYDAQEFKQNNVDMPYSLDADKLAHYVPVSWLNDASTIYPVVMDPFVTTSDSLSEFAVRGSGYTASCDTFGCSYSMTNFSMPANCEITAINTWFSYLANLPCIRDDGGFDIVMNSSMGSCETRVFRCLGGVQGACYFWPAQLLSVIPPLTPCVPQPQCSSYDVDFKLTLRRCNWIPVGGCDSTCILSNEPWIMEATGRTIELTNVSLSQTICEGQCVDLGATADWGVPLVPGTNDYTFTWNGTMIGNMVNVCPDSTTDYIVIATDSCGNSDTAQTTITVVSGQSPDFSILPNDSVCGGTQITFTANSTDPDSLFSWTIHCPTIYTVQDTKVVSYTTPSNPEECTVTMTYELHDGIHSCLFTETDTFYVMTGLSPLVSIDTPDSICAGETITLTADASFGGSAASFQWYLNGVLVPGADSITYTTSFPVQSEVVVSMTSNDSCSLGVVVWDTVQVNIASPVTPEVIIHAFDDTICSGSGELYSMQIFNPGANPSFYWYQNGLLVDSGPTFYTNVYFGDEIVVMMVAGLACTTNDTATDTSTVTVMPQIIPTADIVFSPTTICAGDSVAFSALLNNAPNPSYSWFKNGIPVGIDSTYITSTLNSTDTIVLKVVIANQCGPDNAYDTLAVSVNPIEIFEASVSTPDDTICVGTFATFTAMMVNGGANPSFQWMINGTPVAGATNSTYSTGSLLAGDSVSVEVTSSELCADPTTVVAYANIFIDACLGIDDPSSTTFSLHPNPAANELTILFSSPSNDHKVVSIFDMMGQELFMTSLTDNNQLKIDVSQFARAVYFVKVSEKSGQHIQRLILK